MAPHVHVAGRGGGALPGARAEEEVETVRVHQRPLVARPVAAQRLERSSDDPLIEEQHHIKL
jgi:hypothetical protein